MEDLPRWLEMTVFAAGMTAFAEEVDPKLQIAAKSADSAAPSEPGAAPLH